MLNPFKNTVSPISDLQSRARIKSKQNRQISRSPVQSYREFQVKIIRNALNNNHIIQKQYRSEHQHAFERERRRSKYLGVESQRYENLEQKNYEIRRSDSNYVFAGKDTFLSKQAPNKKRQRDKMKVLGNFQGYSVQNVKSHRMMTYSSNYDLVNEQKSAYILPTCRIIRASKEHQKQDIKRFLQRKCSIANSIDCENEDPYKIKKISKPQQSYNRIDQIREEYFNSQYI